MTANESKVGYTILNKTIQAQLQKDVWLLSNDPSIRYMIWHFYRSHKTGFIGREGKLHIPSNKIVTSKIGNITIELGTLKTTGFIPFFPITQKFNLFEQ